MNTEPRTGEPRDDDNRERNKVPPRPAPGSEAEQKGGKEPAQHQAQRDWNDSSKESGE